MSFFVLFEKADITILNRYDLKGDLVDDVEREWLWFKNKNRHFEDIRSPQRQRQNEERALLHSIQRQMDRVLSTMEHLKLAVEERKGSADRIEEDGDGDDGGNGELLQWLKDTVRLHQYFKRLRDCGFDDLESMKYLTMKQMDAIGITKIGHRLKLMDYIQRMFPVDDH